MYVDCVRRHAALCLYFDDLADSGPALDEAGRGGAAFLPASDSAQVSLGGRSTSTRLEKITDTYVAANKRKYSSSEVKFVPE